MCLLGTYINILITISITEFLQVSNDGILTFEATTLGFSPAPFSAVHQKMVAPFWADVDTRLPSSTPDDLIGGSKWPNDTGLVWFREENDKVLLNRAAEEIRTAFFDQSHFSPTWLFIATWDSVGYYERHLNKVSTIA